MPELQAGVSFGEAAKQFCTRHRTPVTSVVVSIAGVVTGMTAAAAVVQHVALLNLALLAAGAVLAAALCFLQTRHLPLAVLTAVAPLPGLIWAAPVSGGSHFGVLPVLAYGFAFVVAALVAQGAIDQVIGRSKGETPWRTAGVVVGLMAVLAALWFGHRPLADAALQAVADTALAVLSVAALLPMTIAWLHFDESFVAQVNRAREHRGRIFERVAHVTVPRWAYSFTGIAIVFLALGWFGAEPLLRGGLLLKTGSVLLVVIVSGLFAGGWREGAMAGLISAVVLLMALWAMAAGGRPSFGSVGALQILALALLLVLYGQRRALEWRHADIPPVIAQRRLVERASPQTFAGCCAVAALLPVMAVWLEALAFVIATAVALIAAIVFMPAGATALECIAPRRKSVEQLYGRSKNPVHS